MRRTSIGAVMAIVGGLAAFPAATSRDTVAPPPAPIRARRVPDVTPLPVGGTERRLERGDDHRHRVTLSAGEYLRVIVEQHGIDLVAQTRDAPSCSTTVVLPRCDKISRMVPRTPMVATDVVILYAVFSECPVTKRNAPVVNLIAISR